MKPTIGMGSHSLTPMLSMRFCTERTDHSNFDGKQDWNQQPLHRLL